MGFCLQVITSHSEDVTAVCHDLTVIVDDFCSGKKPLEGWPADYEASLLEDEALADLYRRGADAPIIYIGGRVPYRDYFLQKGKKVVGLGPSHADDASALED